MAKIPETPNTEPNLGPKLPKLSSREEFQYKEKTILIEILDQIRNTHRFWYALLIVIVVAAWPVYEFLSGLVAARLIAEHEPLPLVIDPEKPDDIQTVTVSLLPVTGGIYSVYAHTVNPNANWSAWTFDYKFTVYSAPGSVIAEQSGQSFMLPGSSRFLIEPAVVVSSVPTRAEISVENTRWTRNFPETVPDFTILQKRWGDVDGKFFVEGVVKNPYSFSVKKVGVEAIIFDQTNKTARAVNRTVLDDVKPFEERYFRMLWPVGQNILLPQTFGQIQIEASVNPLEPGFGLPEADSLPAR